MRSSTPPGLFISLPLGGLPFKEASILQGALAVKRKVVFSRVPFPPLEFRSRQCNLQSVEVVLVACVIDRVTSPKLFG